MGELAEWPLTAVLLHACTITFNLWLSGDLDAAKSIRCILHCSEVNPCDFCLSVRQLNRYSDACVNMSHLQPGLYLQDRHLSLKEVAKPTISAR